MAILKVLTYPDPRLSVVAKPVKTFDRRIVTMVSDMLETMYAEEGIGLAATQVNIPLQIVVMDLSETRDCPMVLINPRLMAAEGEILFEEGCLSVPDVREEVVRSEYIRIEAADQMGRLQIIEAEDLEAVCIQHEMDHLNGILFVDRLSSLKQAQVRRKIKKAAKQAEYA